MRRILELIYPELTAFPARDRRQVLQQAKHVPLEFIELMGIALALVIVTALTRYSVAEIGLAGRVAHAVANFAVALPLLVGTVGPFLVRRTRRGLRAEMRRRSRQEAMLGR